MSEQSPGSEFHLREESEKVDSDFLGPFWCDKKVRSQNKGSMHFIWTIGEQYSLSNEGEIND